MAAKVWFALKALALAAFVFLAVIVGISVWSNHKRTNILLDSLNQNSIELNKTLVEVNKPKDGLIYRLRVTLDNINKGALDERLFLEQTQPLEVIKLNESLDNFNKLIASSGVSVSAIGTTVSSIGTNVNNNLSSLNIAINDLHPLLVESKKTISNADSLIANKDVPVIIANLKDSTANLKTSSTNVTAMIADTKDYWHKLLHPTWAQKIYSVVTNVGIKVGLALW